MLDAVVCYTQAVRDMRLGEIKAEADAEFLKAIWGWTTGCHTAMAHDIVSGSSAAPLLHRNCVVVRYCRPSEYSAHAGKVMY